MLLFFSKNEEIFGNFYCDQVSSPKFPKMWPNPFLSKSIHRYIFLPWKRIPQNGGLLLYFLKKTDQRKQSPNRRTNLVTLILTQNRSIYVVGMRIKNHKIFLLPRSGQNYASKEIVIIEFSYPRFANPLHQEPILRSRVTMPAL
jgi:hypothetical protein